MTSRDVLKRQIEIATEQLARLDAADKDYPIQDLPPGSVVRFRKRFARSGVRYQYAAIRVGDAWYLTASQRGRVPSPMPVSGFLDFLAGHPENLSGFPATRFQVLARGWGKQAGRGFAEDLLLPVRKEGPLLPPREH